MSNTSAIKRIEGYCCEVTPEQWQELVKVADEVGVVVFSKHWQFAEGNSYVHVSTRDVIIKTGSLDTQRNAIPFPDFLAKLRGEEQLPHIGRDTSLHTHKVEEVLAEAEEWTPKAGEMVEVEIAGQWCIREYIGFKHDRHFVWSPPRSQYFVEPAFQIRPALPRMTRAEVEAKFNIVITEQ